MMHMKNIELDFENIDRWPIVAKVIAVAAICLFLLGFFYVLMIAPQLEMLRQEKHKESELKQIFITQKTLASSVDIYQQRAKKMQTRLRAIRNQLPSDTGIAGFLSEMSQIGIKSGLQFEYFNPQPERPLKFYAELPIQLKVQGKYHEVGQFVSYVASMSRIVSFDDFSLRSIKHSTKIELVMEGTVKTYRYLDTLDTELTAYADHEI